MSPNDQITLICGDFNAEVGKRSPDDTCVGSHTTDRVDRMELGEQLVDFCERHGLFLCNTYYRQLLAIGGLRMETSNAAVVIFTACCDET